MIFDILSAVGGAAGGAVLTVSSSAVYNWVKSKTPAAVQTAANTAASDLATTVSNVATHVANLKADAAKLASTVEKL